VVTPGYVRVVKGEGMPKSKQPGQKGDLRIVFDVQVCLGNPRLSNFNMGSLSPCGVPRGGSPECWIEELSPPLRAVSIPWPDANVHL